jgi:hypothetical protein
LWQCARGVVIVQNFLCALGAGAAARRHAEAAAQFAQGARTQFGALADFAFSDGVAKTDVHGAETKQ